MRDGAGIAVRAIEVAEHEHVHPGLPERVDRVGGGHHDRLVVVERGVEDDRHTGDLRHLLGRILVHRSLEILKPLGALSDIGLVLPALFENDIHQAVHQRHVIDTIRRLQLTVFIELVDHYLGYRIPAQFHNHAGAVFI